jgi:hypothetical protein
MVMREGNVAQRGGARAQRLATEQTETEGSADAAAFHSISRVNGEASRVEEKERAETVGGGNQPCTPDFLARQPLGSGVVRGT